MPLEAVWPSLFFSCSVAKSPLSLNSVNPGTLIVISEGSEQALRGKDIGILLDGI